MSIPDDYDFEIFKKWMDDSFLKRNGGYQPQNLKKWYDKVEENHKPLRALLKGKTKETFEIPIKSTFINEKNPEIESIISNICSILPNIYVDNIQKEDMFYSPTISTSSHSVVKTTKFINNYAENYFKNQAYNSDKYPYADNKIKLSALLSSLGKAWSKLKTSDITFYATVSTTPFSFALMGHYGCEKDSCFRQGSNKTKHKYAIGQSRDTCVITIAVLDDKNNKLKNIARIIGYYGSITHSFHLLNLYFLDKYKEADIYESLKALYKILFDVDKVELSEGHNFFSSKDIHKNEYGNVSLYNPTIYKIKSDYIINIDLEDIFYLSCQRCHRKEKEHRLIEIDEVLVCQECYYSSKLCEISNIRTFKTLSRFKNNNQVMDNEYSYGLPSLVEKICLSCKDCNEMYYPNNKPVCEECYEVNYCECDVCGAETHEDNISTDVIFGDICISCVSEKNIEIFY